MQHPLYTYRDSPCLYKERKKKEKEEMEKEKEKEKGKENPFQ
jgi:hypothetical protein